MNQLIDFSKVNLNHMDMIFSNAKLSIAHSMDQIACTDCTNLSYSTCFHNPLIELNKVNLQTWIFKICKYHPDTQIRKKSLELDNELNTYVKTQNKRQDVCSKILTYFYEKYPFEMPILSEEQVAHVERTIKQIRLTNLSTQSIDGTIDDLNCKYLNTLATNPITIELELSELDGCDPSFKKNKLILSVSTFTHIMKYCEVRETRKKVYLQYFQDINSNSFVMEQIIDLKTQEANILGFQSYSDLALDATMAKNKFEVRNFLNKIFNQYNPQTSIGEIKTYLPDGFKLELWDLRFYAEKIKCAKTNFTLSQAEAMISFDSLLNGIIKICKDLYGYVIAQIANPNLLYSPDIKLFEVTDTNLNQVLGYFYLDIKLQDYKVPGARVVTIVDKTELSLPIGLLVCNFTSKLLFDNVITLFHEFGHMIHFLSGSRIIPINSIDTVPQDFAEIPSKLFEMWAYSEYGLKQIVKPEYRRKTDFSKLSSQLVSHRDILFPIEYSIYLMKAFIDLDLHSNSRITHRTALAHYNKMFYLIEPTCQDINVLGTWPHLAKNYGSEFYSYLWSEHIAKQIYEKFRSRENDKKLARAYVNLLLSKGSLMDFNEQINLFLNLKI